MARREAVGDGSIITLTTDFGLGDPYVAAMKGVILGLNPHAIVVDVSHEVIPQRLSQAVFITQCAWEAFPDGAIHLAVVDPGVGGERQALVLMTPRGCFVGPDNGVLSAALPDETRPAARRGPTSVRLPEAYRAFSITSSQYRRDSVSTTFHGRDVFAPAAAHLSLGVAPADFGDESDTIVAYPPLRAGIRQDGALLLHVVHIDRFGNVVTDVRAEDLRGGPFVIEMAGHSVPGPVSCYEEATGLAALVGSGGYVEVALPGGSAAESLRVDIGDPALLRFQA